MNLYLYFFILSLEITTIICTPKCEDFITCGTCVFNAYDDCQWCSAENHVGKRCQSKNIGNENWCGINAETRLDIPNRVNDVSDTETMSEFQQIKPHSLTIKSASPRVTTKFSMYYTPVKDAPLDIYFFIDNSKDISDKKGIIKEQANSLFVDFKNYTNNVRLGIGTFVEKPALPYADPFLQNVYMFKSHLNLTQNTKTFQNTIENIESSTNYDAPEDILDGLMQIMLCKDINWRNDGRRFIVVFTDAFYHSAGDGKMIGAFKRHNMKCLKGGEELVTDYPSVSQVNKVAKEKGFVIIFAFVPEHKIKSHKQYYYEYLSKKIDESKFVILDLSNISTVIKNEYVKIIADVHFEQESPSNIEVLIKKNCSDSNCKALHSKPLEFVATVRVLSCPNPLKDTDVIKIRPMSLNEELQVKIEYNCQCKCEKNNSSELESAKCNKNGNYECGICNCKADSYGDECKCKSGSMSVSDDFYKCKKNTDDALHCSGHGDCSCGICECHKGFDGPFCEYDKNACPQPGGKLCSGHGDCNMGKCECFPNWVHSLDGIADCGCTTDTRSCMAPYSKEVCSGNGDCKCGTCACRNMTNFNDTCSGRFCDKCVWYAAQRCEELEDFAYCRYLNQTSCEDNYNQTDTNVVFASRSEINSPNNTEWYMANSCRVKKGDDDKIFVFKYYYSSPDTDTESDKTKLILVIQNELDEKKPADIWVAVGSAIGGILLIGLLSLLLWKCLTDMYDAREYDQFVKKAVAAGYDVNMTENPWYEPPMTTFVNPLHNPGTSS